MSADLRDGTDAGTRSPAVPSRGPGRSRRSSGFGRIAATFMLPFFALFVVFQLVPVGYGIWQSLLRTQRSGLGFGAEKVSFVGIDNFARVVRDPEVIAGVARMLLYGIVQVPVMLGIALLIALLVDAAVTRLGRFFLMSAFLPYAIPGVIGAILWSFLYVPGVSPVLSGLSSLNVTVDFLGSQTVLWSIANIATWQWTGYNMIIIFAALQALPHDVLEAATMDGAGRVRTALSIKVPLVLPAILLTGVFSIIGTLQLFSEPTVVRSLTSNVTSTYTPAMAAYAAAFKANDTNYSAAISVTLAVVAFVLSYSFFRLVGNRVST